MNKESNKYIFLYSIALVVVVAAVLSVASAVLRPAQQKNVEVEKKQSILHSVRKAADVKDANNKAQYIEREYDRYITSSFIVNSLGGRVDGDAFEVSLEEEMAKPAYERKLPVFVCTEGDSVRKYILPVRGIGLWGPLWGYVALQDDYSTIYGVVFDHKGETPGLGAEISTPAFQLQFAGKQIFDGATFTSIQVVKGGGTQGKPHEVDAISGGTITSKGLEDMLRETLSAYQNFFKEEKRLQARGKSEEVVDEPEPEKPVVRATAPKPTPAVEVADTSKLKPDSAPAPVQEEQPVPAAASASDSSIQEQ